MLPVTLSQFQLSKAHQSLPKLTERSLSLLEDTPVFTTVEKIELLLLFMHKKWVAEVDIGLRRQAECIEVLDQLQLPWYIESYDPPHQQRWLQVGANIAVLEYVKHRRSELSDLESGILYGFPLTHTLGYVGIIKSRRMRPMNAAQYMLAGVYSEEFYKEEVEYFDKVWEELKKCSPKLALQSKKIFETEFSADG